MKPVLTITHHIFLSREQRYALGVPESEIEVVGCCTPIWLRDGKQVTKIAEEIFAKYRIRHCPEPEKQMINLIEEGFLVRLSRNMSNNLLDYCDNGKESINVTHRNITTVEEEMISIVHFLIIEDLSLLEKTLR